MRDRALPDVTVVVNELGRFEIEEETDLRRVRLADCTSPSGSTLSDLHLWYPVTSKPSEDVIRLTEA